MRRFAPLLAFAIVLAVAGWLVLRPSPGYEVTAVFDQAHGLVKGGEVKVAGQRVGSVKSVKLGRDGYPHVRLRVNADYRLRRGASANLRFFSVSGSVNRYVALLQGQGPELPDGATLGRTQTDDPVEIDQVLQTLTPDTRSDVRAVLAGLNGSVEGRGPQIEETLRHSARALRNTAGLAGEVASDGESLRTFTEKGRRMVGVLARNRGALGSTATELSNVLGTTAQRQEDLARTLDGLPAGLRSPRVALDRTDRAVPDLRALVRAARPAARELVPTAAELRPALAAARPTLRDASGLVTEAPANLDRLRALLPVASRSLRTLTPTLRQANPMLNQARVRTPDFFSFFNNWADFTSSYDVNGNAARVGLVGAPAPLNTIGPNSNGAGHMTAPFMRTPGVLEGDPWTDYEKSFVEPRP